MSAFKAKRAEQHEGTEGEQHVRIIVYAGKSPDSLQFSGAVVLREGEVEEFLSMINREERHDNGQHD